jgi:hypothetical protein
MECISKMEVKIFTKILKPKINKSFWSSSTSPSDNGLEAEVNLWLASKPNVEIKNIKQSQSGGSFAPSTIVISIWYQ